MTLRKGEYEINEDSITIKKEILEQWRDHYLEVSKSESREQLSLLYLGKHDVIVDFLKMFEPLEG